MQKKSNRLFPTRCFSEFISNGLLSGCWVRCRRCPQPSVPVPGGQGWHQVAPPVCSSQSCAGVPARGSHRTLCFNSDYCKQVICWYLTYQQIGARLFLLLIFLFVLLLEVCPWRRRKRDALTVFRYIRNSYKALQGYRALCIHCE